MRSEASAELKVLIGAMLAVAVAVQAVVLPMLAAEAAASFPEVAYLRTPLTALAVLAIACGEAALLCIWRLLTLAGRGAFLTSRTTRWVDALILSLVAGTGMLAAISAVLAADPQTGGGGPAVGLGLMAGMFLGAAVILGVLVWRGRLLQRVRDAAKQQRRAQL
ncbi:DUF2975 domain-containing protein [Arthrobacter sp. zg-Y820]|uniref:DUF2975 domain-containing protein n=1 Tax=unclassified Arthrobacter TaxID=235627 RepID=UPI001E2A846A|nr:MULTISPECIES: DUF2975 domain-containing protein [unclassified Arthrobacter]MCC9196936.1 DUF2975 domain-containing protein [Arthrobacter sp. zg-Y820]MDK1279801.1 DUF2975 domain-containing protein [Arthrobacter sp. zg.Y820]WIB10948.1 DUF2975 domain-containing protein [Arthrobacter sp. zg-Y820]